MSDQPPGPGSAAAPAPDLAADEAMLAGYADALAVAVDAALADWVLGCVERLWWAYRDQPLDDELRTAALEAAAVARAETMETLRRLLRTDVDAQWSSPLAIVRGAVRYPTAVLARAGVPPVVRDPFAERAFPDDVYDLSPANFAAVAPALHEPALVWGAAKAHVVLRRRRSAP